MQNETPLATSDRPWFLTSCCISLTTVLRASLFVPSLLLLVEPCSAQDASLARPAIINSTYALTEPGLGPGTCHLYEDEGILTVDEKWKNGYQYSTSVRYEKVNFVSTGPNPSDEITPPFVIIRDSEGTWLTLTAHSIEEAEQVAEYVARKSSFHLELIGRAWQLRRHFDCPEGGGVGCRDFEELLDHGDPEITDYFYSEYETTHTYSCFNDAKSRFFIVQYTHVGESGMFDFLEFENHQSARHELASISWPGNSGWISSLEVKSGAKPQPRGAIDAVSLSYEANYTSREKTTTQYSLSIRWATGRYTESFSGKDKLGELWNYDTTGVCAKLN